MHIQRTAPAMILWPSSCTAFTDATPTKVSTNTDRNGMAFQVGSSPGIGVEAASVPAASAAASHASVSGGSFGTETRAANDACTHAHGGL